jgi:TRAP-type C4-dicarboxylate transport system permease small subunit
MRKVIAVAATVLLLATAVSGCLGGEKLVTRQASEIILTASDIPGNWTVFFLLNDGTVPAPY